MAAPPFVLVAPPRPAYTNPTTVSPTQFAFSVPADPYLSSITLCLTPGTTLPQDTLAGIYIHFPWAFVGTGFQLLGALSDESPSATFALPEATGNARSVNGASGGADKDAMTDAGLPSAIGEAATTTTTTTITIGISLESATSLLPQLTNLPSQQLTSTSSMALVRPSPNTSNSNPKSNSTSGSRNPEATKVLAQRIIGNAFNFLARFSGTVDGGGGGGGGKGGEEVVPLKRFRDWWAKFEKKV